MKSKCPESFSEGYNIVLIYFSSNFYFLYNRQSHMKTFSTMLIFWFNIFQVLKIGEHQLVLQRVTLQSSGIYSCQITLSGPPFDTVNKEKSLSVYGKVKSTFMESQYKWKLCNKNVPIGW